MTISLNDTHGCDEFGCGLIFMLMNRFIPLIHKSFAEPMEYDMIQTREYETLADDTRYKIDTCQISHLFISRVEHWCGRYQEYISVLFNRSLKLTIAMSVGSVVWARSNGYSYWPSVVCEMIDQNHVKVVFLADNGRVANCDMSGVKPYEGLTSYWDHARQEKAEKTVYFTYILQSVYSAK